jgi:hydrogenase maturation factor HypF (carbamoyltransferase family)
MPAMVIIVRGVLRGFGVRGYIYEQMRMRRLKGFIEDLDINELLVCVEGDAEAITSLVNALRKMAIPAIISDIETYETDDCYHEQADGDIEIIVKDFDP